MSDKKYQIFISSTYKDLAEAREKIIENILNLYHFPIGMEMFSADDDEQWQVIQDTIDQSDYYVVIIGNRYGSETTEGISYTEKEYDYAKFKGIPVLAFIRDRKIPTTPEERESDPIKNQKLELFIQKAQSNKMCDYWTTIDDLGAKVAIALSMSFVKKPGIGWVRADKVVSPEMMNELTFLSKENRDLRLELEALKNRMSEDKPDIRVRLGNEDVLHVTSSKMRVPFLEYPKQVKIEDIPNNLRQYLTQDDVANYNTSDFPTNEEIDIYNQKIKTYFTAKNNPTYFDLTISNIGKKKANEVFVDIIFPNTIMVAKKEDIEDWEFPENIMLEHPVNIAKERLKEQEDKRKVYKNLIDINRGYNATINPNLFRTVSNINKDYSTNARNNKISIKINTLIHTRERMFKNFIIIPYKDGAYEVQVSVMCEEYSAPQEFMLPISVVEECR